MADEKKFLAPVPYKVPMTDRNGNITTTWANWFKDVFTRVGGLKALSNLELEGLPAQDLSELESDVDTLSSSVSTLSGKINDLNQGRHL